MISDVEITSYWPDGTICQYDVWRGADRVKEHEEGLCGAMCSICYSDACDYMEFLEIQKTVA